MSLKSNFLLAFRAGALEVDVLWRCIPVEEAVNPLRLTSPVERASAWRLVALRQPSVSGRHTPFFRQVLVCTYQNVML